MEKELMEEIKKNPLLFGLPIVCSPTPFIFGLAFGSKKLEEKKMYRISTP